MAEPKTTETQRVLLPAHVKPSRYFLHISPEIEASTFTGTVSIELEVVKASDKNSITCHSLELELDKSQIKLKRLAADGATVSSELTTDAFETNAEEETVTFNFGGEPFKIGEKLVLFLAFSGQIGEAISGLYHSNYTINGQSRYVFTQTHPIRALGSPLFGVGDFAGYGMLGSSFLAMLFEPLLGYP
jgi:aminopeptidase N